jgi:hypothetical protein
MHHLQVSLQETMPDPGAHAPTPKKRAFEIHGTSAGRQLAIEGTLNV